MAAGVCESMNVTLRIYENFGMCLEVWRGLAVSSAMDFVYDGDGMDDHDM